MVDFQEEAKSDFLESLAWTRAVAILYGIILLAAPFVAAIDLTPDFGPEMNNLLMGFGVGLIAAGILLPLAPIVVSGIILVAFISFQVYSYNLNGQIRWYMLVMTGFVIWDFYSYLSYRKFADKHLNSNEED